MELPTALLICMQVFSSLSSYRFLWVSSSFQIPYPLCSLKQWPLSPRMKLGAGDRLFLMLSRQAAVSFMTFSLSKPAFILCSWNDSELCIRNPCTTGTLSPKPFSEIGQLSLRNTARDGMVLPGCWLLFMDLWLLSWTCGWVVLEFSLSIIHSANHQVPLVLSPK